MDPRLNRIGQISAAGRRVENLACLINVDSLKDVHRRMDGRKATGIDGVKKEDYYQYYAVTCNVWNVGTFQRQVARLLHKWLNRRSQRRSYTWAQFYDLLEEHPLPLPKCCFNVYDYRAIS